MAIEPLESSGEDPRGTPVSFPPLAVLYKHSPICSISAKVIQEVKVFARDHPDVPVLIVDVLGQRALSQQLSRQLGVDHESPQVIVLKDGKAKWHRSGPRIRLDAIEYAVEAAGR